MAESKHFKFTVESLAAVVCPPSGKPDKSGRVYAFNDDEKGLAYCVTESGPLAFYFVRWFAGQAKRKRLGAAEDFTVHEGRRLQLEKFTVLVGCEHNHAGGEVIDVRNPPRFSVNGGVSVLR